MTSFSCAGVGMAAGKAATESNAKISVLIFPPCRDFGSHFQLQDLLEVLFIDRAAAFGGRNGAVELDRHPPFPTGVVEDLQNGREIHAAASHFEEIPISKLHRCR